MYLYFNEKNGGRDDQNFLNIFLNYFCLFVYYYFEIFHAIFRGGDFTEKNFLIISIIYFSPRIVIYATPEGGDKNLQNKYIFYFYIYQFFN